jgi:hypothetical protein
MRFLGFPSTRAAAALLEINTLGVSMLICEARTSMGKFWLSTLQQAVKSKDEEPAHFALPGRTHAAM